MSNTIIVNESKTINITESGFFELVVSGDSLDIHLEVEKNLKSTLLISVKDVHKINLATTIKDNTHLSILYWHENTTDIKINEKVSVLRDAKYNVAYGDITDTNVDRNIVFNLDDKGAELIASYATVCGTHKHISLDVEHNSPYTEANVENYGIILKDADYYVMVNGHILKGSHQSASHQTSRVLTLDENQKSEVVPTLLIDDNDVMASHAASIGQVDELQLYYLQSRGLSKNEAMQLVTIGYLLPVTTLIEDEALQDKLKETITNKVNSLCLV